ncbi:E3 ubiquitin-protein ligase SHPRH [Phlebotomus argentipes]|uniref:E3 ubiquitin-protein ligase SHPRH n=1 Tax=Phlebotomus argentipes TaxID=94469 RepID=UPI002892FD9F|nr:E3 ubiquitin-protein ligase SHPRH [Phlebotomus argentipes]
MTKEFSTLYENLREAHSEDLLCDEVLEDVQHVNLKPELRPYQRDAVKWLLHRELGREYLPSDYEEVFANNLSNQVFFYNPQSMDIVDGVPGAIEIPTGGILADEMGLGKTVEMLALILNNPRSDVEKPDEMSFDLDDEPLARRADLMHRKIQCLCKGRSKVRNRRQKNELIKCSKCGKSQHMRCVGWRTHDQCEKYICPECWKSEPLVQSKATFIVSPASIKRQWETEIARHVRDSNFRVLVYDGATNSGWIDPLVMAEYDVVLTDYNVMSSEIYYTTENQWNKSLRHEKKHMNPVSPLPCIQWWRVCLDEAQMVEASGSQCAKMVKCLPTVHRWAVTGTPIQKHISNLYGLIFFLDVYPYSEMKMWLKLANPFTLGDCGPLVKVLRKIMWRTCKSMVWDQIGIPLQKEIVHYVVMSDLQTFFYRSQHSLCRDAFVQKVKQVGSSQTMIRMNAHILNKLLEPLRKLRLDCTVPSLIRSHKSDQTTVKKILSPNELHVHLVGNNENEAKSQLRGIASSFNALAGIAMIRGDLEEAEKMYKAVLRRAKDYTGNISVDSLLQIHALHNLIEVNECKSQEEDDWKVQKQNYEQELKQLEAKYINSYRMMMKQVNKQRKEATKALKAIEVKMSSVDGSWWRDIFSAIHSTARESALLEKIYLDVQKHFGINLEDDVRTAHGIDYKLTMWLDKVFECRSEVREAFEQLKFFMHYVNPERVITAEVRQKIDKLIREAFDCHLDRAKSEESDVPEKSKPKKRRKVVCELCEVKMKLRNWECIIFDKIFLETLNSVRGSWNPSVEEVIVRTILAHAKKDNIARELIGEAESHLEYIEALKKEYKEYSQLWSEIDYTVSACDELKMCKSRLEAIHPGELEKGEKKSSTQIFFYELDDAAEQFKSDLQMAEKEFVRIWGVLKYLKHLQKNSGPEVCPICTQVPEEKYSVLECGHHLCMICMVQMRKFHRHFLTCSVCRYQQKYKDVYYVTLNRIEAAQEVCVKGEHSNKICDMIKLILTLVKNEPDVKILVFFHWDAILSVLKSALEENGVKYVSAKCSKFNQAIKEFKDQSLGITCLLLPLAYGSKGLNLVEATHVILLEPILNPGEEKQAIGRVHRIGQTKPTFVHRFIVLGTIEETIYKTISSDTTGKWAARNVTTENLMELFELPSGEEVMDWDEYLQ